MNLLEVLELCCPLSRLGDQLLVESGNLVDRLIIARDGLGVRGHEGGNVPPVATVAEGAVGEVVVRCRSGPVDGLENDEVTSSTAEQDALHAELALNGPRGQGDEQVGGEAHP